MSKRPNILFLTTDQQRFDGLGINSGGFVQTPRLDEIAREGVNLRAFYVNNPVCMPSRACLLTGRYCQNHGVRTNGIPLSQTEVTIAHALGAAGYITANLGKLHFLPHAGGGREHARPHPAYGFDVAIISDEPGCYPDPYLQWIREVAPDLEPKIRVPIPNVEPRSPFDRWVFDAPEELSHTAWVADRTIEFIRQHRDQPWLAIAGFYPPHPPCNAPRRWLDLYAPAKLPPRLRREGEMDDKPRMFQNMARRLAGHTETEWNECRAYYYAMCSMVDFHCGRILDALRELGLLDDTLIVFYSDHGDSRGDHGLIAKHATNYDAVVRVPCIFRLPGRIPAGRQLDALVESVDLMPTVLEAVGAEIPQGVKGKSLWNLITAGTDEGKDSVLIEHKQPGGHNIKTLVTAELKYWVNHIGEEVLFDRANDPDEFVNCARDPDYRDPLEMMRRRLIAKLLEAEDDLPPKIAPY